MMKRIAMTLVSLGLVAAVAITGCETDDVYSTTTIEMTNESDAEMVDQGEMVEQGEMVAPGEMIVE